MQPSFRRGLRGFFRLQTAPIANNKELNFIQRWWLACRPKTLPAAVSPVLVGWGIAFSMGRFQWGPALAAMLCAVLIQIGTNLVNDVADFQKGTDNSDRLGPVRVTQAGLLAPRQVWVGARAVFAAAVLTGGYLVWVGGGVVVVIGLASIAAGLLYTVGPFPLSETGLAGLVTLIFFGFVAVGGTVYVITGQVPGVAWLSGLGVGALVTNVLVVNNIRDIETDRAAGRKNLAVLLGRDGAELQYWFLLTTAYLVPLAMAWRGWASAWVLLAVLSISRGTGIYIELRETPTGRGLNRILAKTAGLALLYSFLLAVGLALGRWFLL